MSFIPKSYKSKNIAIASAALGFFAIAYFLVFNKTIKLSIENKNLMKKKELFKSAPREITYYQSKLDEMNTGLGYVGSMNTLSQEKILDYISQYTDTSDVFLMSMPKTILNNKNGYHLETNVIELQGNFKDIVTLVYGIEHVHGISKVVSSKVTLKHDIYTKKKSLITILYLQNIVI